MSEETKQKLSEIHKGMHAGEKNPMYGVHLYYMDDIERRRKSSEIMKERNRLHPIRYSPTEEQRQKMSERFSGEGNPFYGKKHTDETRAKISAARIKYPVRCIETQVEYESGAQASKVTGIHAGSISRACKTHGLAGGYHWEYIV